MKKYSEIPFEPHCYITSRACPNGWTAEWLEKNGFPTRPVYTVGHDQSKVEVALKSGIKWFVDDRFENFVALNEAGICCFLWDAPHNQRYEVGFKRIYSFKDLFRLFIYIYSDYSNIFIQIIQIYLFRLFKYIS